ncbi:TetR family transcriptional regulator [Pseudomonas sp. Lz4W]|uniref:TetR/AcrR family transcriptional regulator n=1 Tax=unclassified Pseudomonas TaxID=196821 RepID=UPI0002BDA211|nr:MULTISPECIES: TetR/AcrR family transcriptional regulator [unclassified Pseudomonas]AUB74766.1 TetR family transcriptional regulator [Pseudomonas sp. Lz4W]MCH4869168.1 TetR/AcrR family transcriptional regulator [Pseudomonas sp. TMW22089]NBG91935.1 TetR/AcrR family transcriptional regulator [Pseudomonas sp. 9.1(2019)]NNG61982.1 TetR/AcrR family transcriptional regulator [Pseudomonas sp. GC01]
MRYSPGHKAQTHKRIIKEASGLFRRDGIGATGLQPLMKSLGLTHGGFYAHFSSKNELVEKALQHAADEVDTICEQLFSQPQPLNAFIDTYLSQWHVTSPHEGCPLPTMSAEMAQQGLPSSTTDYVINARLEQIEGALEEPDAQDRSIVILATLVGALVLSRGAQSDALREKILAVTRNALKQSDQQA